MSIYTKPVSQITAVDLNELLTNGDVENLRLEFKSDVPDKDETLKKLSSFANTYGGTMVVGAKARSEDGRIESLPGVIEKSRYKQQVTDWCFGGATPPITVEVSDPIPSENGKACYVIRVPESDLAPHFMNGRKGIWVRVDEFSGRAQAALAEESEIRHLLDRRKLILERRDCLIRRARHRLKTQYGTNVSPTRLEMCFVPRFPARPFCEEQKLRELVEASATPYRQCHFPDLQSGVDSQHESVAVRQATPNEAQIGISTLVEANIWGMLFYTMRIIENSPGRVAGIHESRVSGAVSLFIRHAETMLRSMGYSGPIVLETSLFAIRNRQWFYRSELDPVALYPHSGAVLDDEVQFKNDTSAEALMESPDRLAMDLLRTLMFAINLPSQADTSKRLETLLRNGFNFNFWPTTEPLKL